MIPSPGKSAEPTDYIVERRCEILRGTPGFCGWGLSLLDLGCGNGAQIAGLQFDFGKFAGGDVRYPRKWFPTTDRAEFWWGDMEAPQKADERFDRVICFEVLEHSRNESAALGGISYFLKDNGFCAITVPNKWWLFETHGANLPLLPWNRVPFFSWLPRRIHDRYAKARIYTKRQILSLVRQAGLRVVACHYVRAPMDRLPIRWLAKLLRGKKHTTKIPLLATAIMVIAEKNGR